MSRTAFTRRAASAVVLLVVQACAHPTGGPPSANPSDRRAADQVRQVIEAHRDDIERCLHTAVASGPFASERHTFDVVFGVEHHTQGVSKTPAQALLEECVQTTVKRSAPSIVETAPPLVVWLQLRPNGDVGEEKTTTGFHPTVIASDQGNVLSFDVGYMRPPKFISGPDVLYTLEALQHGVEGEARVKCRIRVTGEVADCRIQKSVPYMDEAVIDAVTKRWYQPVRWNEEPVEVDYVFDIKLRLERGKPSAPPPPPPPHNPAF